MNVIGEMKELQRLAQLRQPYAYLSIKDAAFLSLDIHVPSVPYATDPMGMGLANAVRNDKSV
jgi:hypothetical protein